MIPLVSVTALLLGQAAAAPAPAAPAPVPPVIAQAMAGEKAGPVMPLAEALSTARARNLDLKVAQERLEQSKELHWKAWSSYLPQVGVGGTFTHNSFDDVTFPSNYAIRDVGTPTSTDPTLPGAATNLALVPYGSQVLQKQDQLAGQIQATQALIAPQAWFGIASARAGERLASNNVEFARRDILFGVAQAYYAAAGLQQVVGIQERQLAIALQHEKDARVRYDAGTAPKIVLLRAEIDRSRAEQDLKRAQNAYVAGRVALATLLDRQDVNFEVEVPAPPQPVAGNQEELVAGALRDRFDLKAAANQVEVYESNRSGLWSRYLPTLGAFGRYQYSNAAGFSGTEWSWAVGLALNWTILDGFLRESDLRENESQLRQARAQQAAAEANVRQEVANARIELDSAVANRDKATEELTLAKENQRLVDVNYRAGAATYLEVTDANTALLQAELSKVSEALRADLAALRLLRAVGVFNPS